ncbi:MAG: heavy metal translocating P-type ATPase [Gammaproteobacteria bacterium]|nr:heavy metal translocating P-type ATPase [Gammaproteobacteria bacterium]
MSLENATTEPAAQGAAEHCFHCSLPVVAVERVEANIAGEPRAFCCNGCRSVCEAIHAAGLEGFYQRTPDGTPLGPPPELPRELALFDLDEVQEEFVPELGEQRDIHLLVEGIHCAACVWLIEKSLQSMPGVSEARVNLTGRKLHVRWNNLQTRLSAIIQRLGQIGYAAVPYDPETAEGRISRENRALLYRMAFAGFTMMNLLWVSIALYAGADEGEYRTLFHWVGFALATPTLLYSGYPFYRGALSGLRNLHLGMDLPIAIGATVTYGYSLFVTLSANTTGEVYYDTVVNFLFVILVGRYLEAMSKRQAVASTQRLLDLQPRVATVRRDAGEQIVPIRSVKQGEQVLVKPGERIPVDGVVSEGVSAVNEAMLSGESQEVEKRVGSAVSAGTINGHGALIVEVEGVLRDTALGRIINLVEEAQASRAPIQCVADRIVPWFVAATIGLAIATFFWWLGAGIEKALMASTAVLIITCPCAFGLATPMAIAVASGQGARHGILVKNGEVLETLSGIREFVFDKTGTLTEGRMRVHSIATGQMRWLPHQAQLPPEVREVLARLALLERRSEHPLAAAVVACAEQSRALAPDAELTDLIYRPGLGLSARLAGVELLAGSSEWMRLQGVVIGTGFVTETERLDRQGIGHIHYAEAGEVKAVVAISDKLRDDAKRVITALKREGMAVTLLSGDRQQTAEIIAEQLGGMRVIAEVLPQQKDQVIRELQQQGCSVAMVGDGVNDAPALVRADVGIAMGTGTDVSIASADIVLMSSELEKVRQAGALSRRTLRTIRQNIAISITYNLIMVPLAMMALVTPLVAAVSMPVSSLLVIGNAARIRTLFR